MAKKAPKKHPRASTTHGEDHLASLEAIIVKLENGSTVEFNRKEELSTEDGTLALLRQARDCPARYAFWAYQSDRALAVVRRLEVEVAELEGETYLVYRKWYQDETDEDYISDGMIRSRVASDDRVITIRKRLNRARKQYDMLRTMRYAQEHRCYVLRRLIARDAAEAIES